jgi:hypothetical protein
MAVPSSGQLSLYGLAKEKEINNYDNTIPISTYNSYYATPISLGNMATGAGGFDATNEASEQRPNIFSPHAMSEWYGYDHDAAWTPSYINNPVNKSASYISFSSGQFGNNASIRTAYQRVRKPGYTSWTVDNTNVYQNGQHLGSGYSSQDLTFLQWNLNEPQFAVNADNYVQQSVIYDTTGKVFSAYIEPTISFRFYDVFVGTKYATLTANTVTNNNSYIYVEWTNTSAGQYCEIYINLKFYYNPLI